MKNVLNIWHLYKKAQLRTRLHILGRFFLCPFFRLLRYFPESGDILDVGCGHGVLLYYLKNDTRNTGRRLTGIDHDARKIETAKYIENADVKFIQKKLEEFPVESFDAISIIDVLYAVRMDEWKIMLDNCFRLLRSGGRLIIKDAIDEPRWKYWITMFEEKLAVEFFRITQSERPHIESKETFRNALKMSGFTIFLAEPIRTWSWLGHYLIVADKKQI